MDGGWKFSDNNFGQAKIKVSLGIKQFYYKGILVLYQFDSGGSPIYPKTPGNCSSVSMLRNLCLRYRHRTTIPRIPWVKENYHFGCRYCQ